MKKFLAPIGLYYLKFFAKLKLRRMKPIVIGVGGASGKSSVSLMVAQILSHKFRVLQSKGKNSETGIPLTILGIEMKSYGLTNWAKAIISAPLAILKNKKYDYFVCEMGIDGPRPPRNMGYLLSILTPDIGILTNVDVEHSVYFDDLVKDKEGKIRKKEILRLLARDETKLLKTVKANGRAIINLDDPFIKKTLPINASPVTVSARDKKADFYISKTRVSLKEFRMEIIFLNEKYYLKIKRPLPKYYAYSFALCLAVAFSCGLRLSDAIKYLEKDFSLPPGRFTVFEGIKDSVILDSSYNSSLGAAKGALDLLTLVKSGRRKVGILGDMRELGSLSKAQHEELAKSILKNLDYVILIGPQMKELVAPVLTQANFKFISFGNFSEAREGLTSFINQKDLILVKGSQNTLFLERAVELLLKNKEDVRKLARREAYWKKLREV